MPTLHRLALHLQQIPPALLAEVAQIDELKGQWVAGARFNPQILAKLKQSVLVTSTGASTRIEGARLSDEDVEKLMRGIAIAKFADCDKQEVQGYFELLQNIFDSWPMLSFNEGTVKHFHQELLKYVEKDRLHRGAYKKTENKVHMVGCVVPVSGRNKRGIDKLDLALGTLHHTDQAEQKALVRTRKTLPIGLI